MARWEPGAVERLQKSALDLFGSQGFDGTTAAQIADAAGLTERTFFRHFGDKRDVLFHGQQTFVRAFLDGMETAAPDASPLRIVAGALASASGFFPDDRRPYSRLRQTVIDANPALQERERHKLAGLAVELAAALRTRGVEEPAATLAAESGATVFSLAFAAWIRPDETRSVGTIAAGLLDVLMTLDAPPAVDRR